MSLVMTLYVREGIVMASDSRLTLSSESTSAGVRTINLSVALSDANYKTFLAPNRIGISTYGAADILGVPIAGNIESFIAEKLEDVPTTPEQVAKSLLSYFRQFDPPPQTQFHVAGYAQHNSSLDQQVWIVDVAGDRVSRVNPHGQQGATWGGEADILGRLLQPVAALNEAGEVANRFPHAGVPFQYFTLQDAIDFAIFGLRATIDAIRFQPRAKTVGGPIDILVIKPTQATWIQRKELHGEAQRA